MDKLPKEWNIKHLGELCKLENGDRGKNYPSQSSFVSNGIPFINAGNLDNFSISDIGLNFISEEHFRRLSNGKFVKGDILFCLRGSLGKFAIVETEAMGAIASSLVIIRPHSELNLGFLKAYLQSGLCADMIRTYDNGSAQPNLAAASLKKFQIPLPPLPEQTRIVNKLDSLFERIDKSIALLEENIKHTEALMASVLDEVFSNGDTRIGDLCTIGPKKSEIKDLGDLEVSFLPMTDLKEHQINFEPKQTKRISEVYTGYTYFNDNDVLLAKVTPCFENGKAGIAQNLINGIGFGSSEYHVLRANKNTLPEWIYYSVMTATFREEGVNNMTGSSGLKRVPPAFVANWKIKNPPINEQLKIIEKIKSTDAKLSKLITEQQSKLNYLKALKASLLDKAFKGEL